MLLRLMAVGVLFAVPAGYAWAEDATPLRVLSDGYPRAFFFRASEGLAADGRIGYDRWQKCFSRLMGIEGKVLDEEVPGRSARNIEFFTRFKKEHPDQLVLLHYNGNARDPRFQTQKYFAGHWLYFDGARILSDVPAEEGETEIEVHDPALFRVQTGRYLGANEDLGLCMLDGQGRPDWHRSEQVQLVAVDPARKAIRVRRGCYGTSPRTFPAGRAYAAAHMTEGPWGRRSNLMWFYNYATCCPSDRQGRTCSEVHAEELAARFSPGGELAAFDGLEFDVLHHRAAWTARGRGADCDADGKADYGFFDGRNRYGIGVVEFCRLLRSKLGPGRIIQADGAGANSQRAFEILNGIESEGWPHLSDWEIRDWSGGLNRHFFWQQNARPPVFNYVNHKYTTAGAQPGQRVRPQVPFGVHRLVLAAAVFTDSAVCYSFVPDAQPGELLGIWDELRMGTENRIGWLGLPLGPVVRLAEKSPDVLDPQSRPPGMELLEHLQGRGLKFVREGAALTIVPTGGDARQLRFRLRDVPCAGPDLFVSVTAEGQPLSEYPVGVARLMSLGIAPPAAELIRRNMPSTGMCLRGGAETDLSTDSGAVVQWIPSQSLAGQSHDAYLAHPPYRGRTGYTFWHRDVRVPRGGRLELLTGMGQKSPQRSDGVTFRVLVAEVEDGKAGRYTQVFEHSQVASKWMEHLLPLSDWGGKTVRLKFVCDCGPHDDPTTDHAYWADVALLGAEGRSAWTPPVQFTSWLNDRPFKSTFYFHDVRSKTVDLQCEVEGRQPIWILSITAHQHADVVYRQFQHGLVLANPSPRPYTFDLRRLLSGRKYRRLRGSSRQDPVANDGSPVEGRLTLPGRDALFLVQQ